MAGLVKDNKLNSGIDLRQEMQYFLNTTEYRVLLQRLSHVLKCDCYKEEFTEAQAKCPKCLGSGKLFKFTKEIAYKQNLNIMDSMLFTGVGNISDTVQTFFFRYDVHPQKGDYIWEVTWNHENGKPIKLVNLFYIIEVADMRGEFGRIEYYACLGRQENIDMDFKNMYIGKAWRDMR